MLSSQNKVHLIVDFILNRTNAPNTVYGFNVRNKLYSEMEKSLTETIARDILAYAQTVTDYEGDNLQELLNPVLAQWRQKIQASLR